MDECFVVRSLLVPALTSATIAAVSPTSLASASIVVATINVLVGMVQANVGHKVTPLTSS